MKRLMSVPLLLVLIAGICPYVQAEPLLDTSSVGVCVSVDRYATVKTPLNMTVSLRSPQDRQGGPGVSETHATIIVTTNNFVNLEVAATILSNKDTGLELPSPALYGYELDSEEIPRNYPGAKYAFVTTVSIAPGQRDQHSLKLWADWFIKDRNGHTVDYQKVTQGSYQGLVMVTVSPV